MTNSGNSISVLLDENVDGVLAYLWAGDELLTDGACADDPPELGYDLRSDPIARVHERFRSRTGGLLETAG